MRLTNEGRTTWLHLPRASGYVTLALCRGKPGDADLAEAPSRNPLPGHVRPGQSVEMDAAYLRPDGGWVGDWRLDLVNEGCFWFNVREPVPLTR